MPNREFVAGRQYVPAYRVSGRRDLGRFVTSAIEASGADVGFASDFARAPLYVSAQTGAERIGLVIYAFRATHLEIRNRPLDEHRAQIRYGAEPTWERTHRIGRDPSSTDVTLVVAAHPDSGIFVGLDSVLYDPLPMGISVEFKDDQVSATQRSSWFVWERINRGGSRRPRRRSLSGLETLIGFTPDRLLDYARFERRAFEMRLDPELRARAARAVADDRSDVRGQRHSLEKAFAVDRRVILDVIERAKRLGVAVKGGVAEHHLANLLQRDPFVAQLEHIDQDGQPDFRATLRDGRSVLIECKNANAAQRVDLQKTRSAVGQPESRLYLPDQFDVVAGCLWPPNPGPPPRFKFRRAAVLPRSQKYPTRISPNQRVDEAWHSSLAAALAEA
jgi:hypothetical protein